MYYVSMRSNRESANITSTVENNVDNSDSNSDRNGGALQITEHFLQLIVSPSAKVAAPQRLAAVFQLTNVLLQVGLGCGCGSSKSESKWP